MQELENIDYLTPLMQKTKDSSQLAKRYQRVEELCLHGTAVQGEHKN